MFPARFDYFLAKTLEQAFEFLEEHEGAKVLAGGHSLIPVMKTRLAQPPALVDIGRIEELKGIFRQGDRVRIGALTTHAELSQSPVLHECCSLLPRTAIKIADPQVRNCGTIGGNLSHADPGSDLPAAILALEADLHVAGPDGGRKVAASEFFQDLFVTDLRSHEILTAVEVPVLPARSGTAYLKFEHPASGYAVCGVAVRMELAEDGSCREVHLAFNGLAATPWKASDVEAALKGKEASDQLLERVLQSLPALEQPLGDRFASAEYRLELARFYGVEALKMARDEALLQLG